MWPLPQSDAGIVVVVVGATQPPASQASQQLAKAPVQPPRAVHLSGVVTLQLVRPPGLVVQHGAMPARPQLEFFAQRFTLAAHAFGNVPATTRAFVTPTTHFR